MENATATAPEGSIAVSPGESIQNALETASVNGKWVVAKRGLHVLPAALKMPGNVTLAGEGIQTILFLNPDSGGRDAIINTDAAMHNITIRDLVIEGSPGTDPVSDPNSVRSFRNQGNRGGIIFRANNEGDLKNISLINITVRNCTYNGVFLNGINGLNIVCCDFTENGSGVVPGPKLQHNLLITRSSGITVKDSRLDTSPNGCGLAFGHCSEVKVLNCEIARNGWYGVLITECNNISVAGNHVEANDKSGIMAEFLYNGSENVTITDNLIQYNNGFGLESWSVHKITQSGNIFEGNGTSELQVKISEEKSLIMQ
jgi:hypothetical protein